MISKYKTHLEDLKSLYHRRLGAKEELEQNIDKTNAQIQTLESISGQSILALELLSQVSKVAREKAKTHLESIVTEALVYILGNDYKFVIDLGESGGKPTCEFYVETTVNGEVSRQKPEQACGGGVVDIISTALRYAYLEIFNDPTIKNKVVILDEPGKMVSEQASEKFADFIRYLGQTFNKQTIMITHNDTLMTVADKTFHVSNVSGKSQVTEGVIHV